MSSSFLPQRALYGSMGNPKDLESVVDVADHWNAVKKTAAGGETAFRRHALFLLLVSRHLLIGAPR